jgi:hypothetical protein
MVEPGAGISTTGLSLTQYNKAREFMANGLRDIMALISPDAKLHPSEDNPGIEAVGNLDVYHGTTRASHTGVSSLRNEWWLYVDPTTGLPKRIELYRERPGETQRDLVTTTEFTYLTEQEMDHNIQVLFPAK